MTTKKEIKELLDAWPEMKASGGVPRHLHNARGYADMYEAELARPQPRRTVGLWLIGKYVSTSRGEMTAKLMERAYEFKKDPYIRAE